MTLFTLSHALTIKARLSACALPMDIHAARKHDKEALPWVGRLSLCHHHSASKHTAVPQLGAQASQCRDAKLSEEPHSFQEGCQPVHLYGTAGGWWLLQDSASGDRSETCVVGQVCGVANHGGEVTVAV